MQNDNQHLDFLISQHVDGCLDAAGKKSVEQHLMTDPDARKLYQEHREVQDVLEDWGGRIPMVNWAEFDQKLAGRLERETVGGKRENPMRKWYRPVAAAAALFVAASIGYGWHAVAGGTPAVPADGGTAVAKGDAPSSRRVTIDEPGVAGKASSRQFGVDEAGAGLGSRVNEAVAAGKVTVTAPGDVAAAESLRDSVMNGLSNLSDSPSQRYNLQPGSASAMNGFEQKRSEDRGADRDGMAPLP